MNLMQLWVQELHNMMGEGVNRDDGNPFLNQHLIVMAASTQIKYSFTVHHRANTAWLYCASDYTFEATVKQVIITLNVAFCLLGNMGGLVGWCLFHLLVKSVHCRTI